MLGQKLETFFLCFVESKTLKFPFINFLTFKGGRGGGGRGGGGKGRTR